MFLDVDNLHEGFILQCSEAIGVGITVSDSLNGYIVKFSTSQAVWAFWSFLKTITSLIPINEIKITDFSFGQIVRASERTKISYQLSQANWAFQVLKKC